jgi:hypothetical protein
MALGKGKMEIWGKDCSGGVGMVVRRALKKLDDRKTRCHRRGAEEAHWAGRGAEEAHDGGLDLGVGLCVTDSATNEGG